MQNFFTAKKLERNSGIEKIRSPTLRGLGGGPLRGRVPRGRDGRANAEGNSRRKLSPDHRGGVI